MIFDTLSRRFAHYVGRLLPWCCERCAVFIYDVCSGSIWVLKKIGTAGSPTFKTVVERVKSVVQDAVANADIPFYQVVDAANVARSSSYTPIFQTQFTLASAVGEAISEATNTSEEAHMGDLATDQLAVCSSAHNLLTACLLSANRGLCIMPPVISWQVPC